METSGVIWCSTEPRGILCTPQNSCSYEVGRDGRSPGRLAAGGCYVVSGPLERRTRLGHG